MVNGFAHVALYTPAFYESIKFYTEAFGAENLGEFQAAFHGCWLKLGDGILEIFEDIKREDGSFKHIALACDDVDKQYEQALAAGAEEEVKPKDVCLGLASPVNARVAFVRGPAGEDIELFAVK